MSTNNKISSVVSEQLPFFVRNDHPLFVSFLEAYYEYLEQSNTTLNFGKPIERTKTLTDWFDIDNAPLDEFSNKLYAEFLESVPKETVADRRTLLKHIKDFYRAKGTEKALKFILRALFNKDTSVYYPKKDVFIASGSSWFKQKSLRVTNTAIDYVSTNQLEDLDKFKNRRITGVSSGATAVVERTDRFFVSGVLVDELIITSTKGTFENNEQITANYTTTEGGTQLLSANTFGSYISEITILNPGTGYEVGTYPIVEVLDDETGVDGNLRISRVSTGNISNIGILLGGAGFTVNNYVTYSGGGGTGANSQVATVDLSESVHPNSYNIIIDTIGLEANTNVSNAVYSNIGNTIAHANTTLANALGSFTYGPTGPATTIFVNDTGNDYSSEPDLDINANTRIRTLGILGRMSIEDPGQEYRIGDIIEFDTDGGFGYGANAIVSNVNPATLNSITEVSFVANSGYVIGGFGYSQNNLPTTNVATATGNGANILVTAILGDGESLVVSVGTIGAIEEITIVDEGEGYSIPPTINLTSLGSGTAQANATIVQGVFTYPGRYLNDKGHLSSHSFLQGKDYYQNYSYVVKIQKSIMKYREALKKLNHPIGLKLFGEYVSVDEVDSVNSNIQIQTTQTTIFQRGEYTFDNVGNTIIVTKTAHGIANSDNAYLEFIDGTLLANGNGFYTIVSVPDANSFNVNYVSAESNGSGNVSVGRII